ncbi:hypothetical protein BHE74_00032894 [Ensete ventricosum]|nr:hypothetical protein GW17_00016009 [Ensete ventricosum]RWW60126.1 hypothetical protein BHE74_00032894 [Ensete ventricosum]RZS09824.1 hypothetical protein BHM03_00040941 [Ensete ventricosum]
MLATCNMDIGLFVGLSFLVRPRSAGPNIGGVLVPRGQYVGSPAHQPSVPFGYQQGFPYPPYRLVDLLNLFRTIKIILVFNITGLATPVPAQPHFIVPAHSPQFVQGSSSDQTAV